ncbi:MULTISPECIES: hypothetical protein [Nocardia]|uniref:hypothetical protein n=1 Tax=Nocardia TaxID=1817 RepID=UPI00135988CC|nr:MULTISPECIES: hypothetical protein [Nocardia]
MGKPRVSRRILWISLLIAGMVVVAVAVIAFDSVSSGKLPWTKTTYAAENATDPCGLIDGSVLRRWTGTESTTREGDYNPVVGDRYHDCTASSVMRGRYAQAPEIEGTAIDATISVSTSVWPSHRRAGTVYESQANPSWEPHMEYRSRGGVPDLGQKAYFERDVIEFGENTRVDYQIGVLDDNLYIEVSMRFEFSHSHGVAPTTTADIDDIQRTTEQQARRAMDKLRR